MSRAFKCDVCGELVEERPNVLHVKEQGWDTKIFDYDVCNVCLEHIYNYMFLRGHKKGYKNVFGVKTQIG